MSFQDARATWDKRFSGTDYHFGREPNVFLASQAHRLKPGMSALCIADGEGRNSVWLARQGLRVSAFDISPVGVNKAQTLAADAGVSIDSRVGDIETWDWDAAQYDVVAAIFFQFAAPALRARIFAGIQRALKPGGLLLLQGYGLGQLEYKTGGPGEVENLYTTDLIRESFAALKIVHLAEHDDELSEGVRHQGMSALVDFVGHKPA